MLNSASLACQCSAAEPNSFQPVSLKTQTLEPNKINKK